MLQVRLEEEGLGGTEESLLIHTALRLVHHAEPPIIATIRVPTRHNLLKMSRQVQLT